MRIERTDKGKIKWSNSELKNRGQPDEKGQEECARGWRQLMSKKRCHLMARSSSSMGRQEGKREKQVKGFHIFDTVWHRDGGVYVNTGRSKIWGNWIFMGVCSNWIGFNNFSFLNSFTLLSTNSLCRNVNSMLFFYFLFNFFGGWLFSLILLIILHMIAEWLNEWLNRRTYDHPEWSNLIS